MNRESLYQRALELTKRRWELEPVRGVRMPVLDRAEPVSIDALWTDGGLRPSANNLAFLIQRVSSPNEMNQWKQRLGTWPIRGSLLIVADELHLLTPRSNASNELQQTTLNIEDWQETLVSSKQHLFTLKALAKFREGQLSLADLEETVSERSFTFLSRQQTQIDVAFQKGIDAALNLAGVSEVSTASSRLEIRGHIIRYAIAYLAARILQDKNFFNIGSTIHADDQSPTALLNRMIQITNGFFSRAKQSEQFVPDLARQALVNYMGYKVSFVLTDHRDVGRLYESAIKKLPKELGSDDWGDLNRYYTPVKLAERMLDALPLERLRPEDRFIFDPAAGSGSLLLAATSRLARMPDIPTGNARKAYLESHIAGNDLDRYADLIAKLRYFLASESLGISSNQGQMSEILPFPCSDNFTHRDYEKLTKHSLPIQPKVIVANPPFSEKGKTQMAAKFVEKTLEWLGNDSQLSLVLPQSFLVATTHGIAQARELLTDRCKILDVWQCPEKSVGVSAEQAVCFITAVVGQPKKVFLISARAVYSRSEAANVREQGFLGSAWISSLTPDNKQSKKDFWPSTVAPSISLSVSTIPLGSLFYVFNGVNPGRFSKIYPPEREQKPNISYKRNWKLKWRDSEKLWANPENVPEDSRWIRYGREYLEGSRPQNRYLFDCRKVLVARKVNRGSKYPLAAQFDDTGFCPDNNIYCLSSALYADKYNRDYEKPSAFPNGWDLISEEDRCLWLLSICASKIANHLSLIGRKSHEITVSELCRLPLPSQIDFEIINIIRRIIELEKEDSLLEGEYSESRDLLNRLVEKSYGNPTWKEIARTGRSSDLESWKEEQKIETKSATCQVLKISEDKKKVYMYIGRLMEDDDTDGEWLPLPPELPGWALDGTAFSAELSDDIRTFDQLRERPWALREFRHTPRPYLTDEELNDFLTIPSLEVHS